MSLNKLSFSLFLVILAFYLFLGTQGHLYLSVTEHPDAVTAATHPPDNPTDSVINLHAEITYGKDMDFEGEWSPNEDVQLSWEPTPNGEETEYEIWVTTTPGNFEKLDTIKASKTEYTNIFITMSYDEVEYITYKVRAIFGDQPGSFSTPVSVKNPNYSPPVRQIK